MNRSALFALYLAVFLDLAGFSMVIPDIQTRLEAEGASGTTIGIVLSVYFLVQIIASPLWGRLSDRIGRKPVLVVCGALSALSLLAYAFANSLPLVMLSRVLAGTAAANVVAAQAYLADANPDEEKRTASMGRIGAVITAGLLLGPALGGWLSALGGNYLLGLVAAALSGFGALWIAVALPSISPVAAPPHADARKQHWLSLLRDVPTLRPFLMMACIGFFALACLEGTFGRLIHRTLGYGPPQFGLIFSYESLLGVLVQGVILGWVTQRWHLRPRALLSGGFVLQGIGLGLTPFSPNLAVLFGCSTLYGLGSGVGNPILNAQCSEATPANRQGEMFGLLQAARSTGFLIGPTLGGSLFDWRPEAPYIMAGVVLLIAALFATLANFSTPPPTEDSAATSPSPS